MRIEAAMRTRNYVRLGGLTLLAWVAYRALVVGGAMMGQEADLLLPAQRWGARAAILAMQATTSPSAIPSDLSYVLAPSDQPLTRDELVEALVRIPKPVSCRAQLMEDKLIVSCQPIAGTQLVAELGAMKEENTRDLAAGVKQLCRSDTRDPLVLLATGQDAIVFPLSGLLTFQRDYDTPHSLVWQSVLPEMLPRGVCALFTLGPPLDVRVTVGP